MGLDMYLNARRFLRYGEDDLGQRLASEFPELDGRKVQEVIVEAVYWRKANAIHKWFVDNVQDGTDDCGTYRVSRDQLARLKDLVLEVIDSEDATLLPPSSGFFFGSTEVDDWYWQDLKSTYKQLDSVLEEFPESWDFEYHSSW